MCLDPHVQVIPYNINPLLWASALRKHFLISDPKDCAPSTEIHENTGLNRHRITGLKSLMIRNSGLQLFSLASVEMEEDEKCWTSDTRSPTLCVGHLQDGKEVSTHSQRLHAAYREQSTRRIFYRQYSHRCQLSSCTGFQNARQFISHDRLLYLNTSILENSLLK